MVEHVGSRIRVWADVDIDAEEPIPRDNPYVEFARSELTDMLDGARLRLAGFRDRARDWALEQRLTPSTANRLAEALDRGLEISGRYY
ncbi:hypothetical protein ACQEVB_18635 [Pseudonocardia sp. CA-107938]|uniref:hypothetical protein n=1 Tax=Pseudonocardia sp. CA-107938 TaxID=3240021 RepID=UPI003D8BC71B